MLDFDVKKLVFKFKGEKQEIDYPNVKMINSFRKKLKAEDSDEVECTIDLLCNLGAEREVIEQLRVSQLNSLVEELTSEMADKKN